MKILQLHTGFNLHGGVESLIIGLANELAKSNDVTVCSVFRPNKDSVFYSQLNSNVKKEHLGLIKTGFSITNIIAVYRYLRGEHFDIVHFHGLFYYFAFAILLTHKRFKFVYTFHSDAYREHGKWDKRIMFFKRFCLRHHWMYPVTISLQSQLSFREYYGLDSKLIENGIPCPAVTDRINKIEQFRINPATKVFVHPGRISEPKNQAVLCRVFRRLIAEGNDVMLLIAGIKQDDYIYEDIRQYFSERIIYLGERDDIPQLLYNSDGMCLPSIWEGLPITLLESLAVGCIPICSPVGGIINVIKNGVNGFLSKSSAENDYYETMTLFLNTPAEDIPVIKASCKSSFARYSIKETAIDYVSFYNQILNNESLF